MSDYCNPPSDAERLDQARTLIQRTYWELRNMLGKVIHLDGNLAAAERLAPELPGEVSLSKIVSEVDNVLVRLAPTVESFTPNGVPPVTAPETPDALND
jgi:hypothetical protein